MSHALRLAVLALCAAEWVAAASGLKVLHSFGVQFGDGSDLYGALLRDPLGNLYGTAESGGRFGYGIVFKLTPQSSGGWKEAVLYSFRGGTQDGAVPHDALIMDRSGNLYGTTTAGGGGACPGGCGIVFQLVRGTGGAWTETVLHRFSGSDGATPYSGVIADTAGNLYGTSSAGGASGAGTIYRLARGAAGWTATTLYSFQGAPDGAAPYAAPVLDAAGNLYGTTYRGGTANMGTVYRLSPQAGGAWSATVLHSFHGAQDGTDLFESLVMDARGNLYGAAETGGSANCGVVFRLAPDGSGGWKESILHTFLGILAQDGENPNAVLLDAAGNLWGTTVGGGIYNPGTIFKLAPQASGAWVETILYNFTGGNDGAYPSVPLIMNPSGHLFGTTLWGGPAGTTVGGTAFEFTP